MGKKSGYHSFCYRTNEIPDPAYRPYADKAGGDVSVSVAAGFQQLIRIIAEFPPDAITAGVRFSYAPGKDLQKRLSLQLRMATNDPEIAAIIPTIIEQSPLNSFYTLRQDEDRGLPGKLSAACHLLRRNFLLHPITPVEENEYANGPYFIWEPFEPNEKNNYFDLDSILSRIEEEMVIDLSFTPADTRKERESHCAYMAWLQKINDTFSDNTPQVHEHEASGQLNRYQWGQDRSQRKKEPVAEDALQVSRKHHESLIKPHVAFHVIVLAQSEAVARLVGSIVAECAFSDGSYELFTHGEKKSISKIHECLKLGRVVSQSVHPMLTANTTSAGERYAALERLPFIATREELFGLFTFPVGTTVSPQCIRMNTDPRETEVTAEIKVGVDSGSGFSMRGLPLKGLAKHMFISGVPGAGKSTGTINLLIQLQKHRIPFLVLECAKTEYRGLLFKSKAPDEAVCSFADTLRVYAPGNEKVSPLRFNPFEKVEGIDDSEQVESLLACFKGAIPMEGSMPGILGDAIEQVSKQSGKDRNARVRDLVEAIGKILKERKYSDEVYSNMRAMFESRIGVLSKRSMGQVFGQEFGLTPKDLLENPTLLELDRLPSEQKCLLCLFILTAIYQQIKTTPQKEKELRFVILIEEAHNVIGRNSNAQASDSNVDSKAFAAEYICRMLAELRALGVGIVIVDQLPTAVAAEVIKNTGTKLTFRQVAQDDREEIGGTMLLDQTEIEELARLNVGGAYFYTEGYHGPRKIQTIYNEEIHELPAITDEELTKHLHPKAWHKKAYRNRLLSELVDLDAEFDRYLERSVILGERLDGLKSTLNGAASLSDEDARVLKATKQSLCNRFMEMNEHPAMGTLLVPGNNGDKDFRALQQALKRRFDEAIKGQTDLLLYEIAEIEKRRESGGQNGD